jgi:hypothetical protein
MSSCSIASSLYNADINTNRGLQGDGVCDTTHGQGINAQHLQYPNDAPTQNLGTQYITKQLGGSS